MGSDRSSPFVRHVGHVTDRFDALLPFVAVPLLLSVLEFETVRRALDPGPGFSINLEFALPSPLLDLWSFADPPPAGSHTDSSHGGGSSVVPGGPTDRGTTGSAAGGTDVTIETPLETIVMPLGDVGVGILGWLATALLVYAAISAVISAGYLGGIDRCLRGEPAAILACISEYAPRLFLYHLAVFAAFVAVLPVLAVVPPLVVLAIPVVIVLGYLFYAVPFLFVVDDAAFLEAFRRSYGFALEGGPYLRFALWHVAVAVVASILLSIAVSAGGVGFVLALVVAAPLALVLTGATVSFVGELAGGDGPGAPTRSRPGSSSDDGVGSVR